MRRFFKKNFSSLHRKFITVFLIGALFVPSFYYITQPTPADALLGGGPVVEVGPLLATTYTIAALQVAQTANETSLTLKEYVGDSIMWFVAKVLLQRMTQSVVSWINNGFNGSPAFVSNPETFFSTLADQIAGNFILNDPDLNFLCSPFGAQLRIGLNNQRQRPFLYNIRCTLTNVVGNINAFTHDFSQGGWVAWDSMTQEDQNNPYGAYFALTGELERQQNSAQNSYQNQLNWGNGFLTFTDKNGNAQTPGSVIEKQLEDSLGSGVRQLEAADEINEIIGALMTQLVSKALSSLSGGLRGLGSASGLNDGGADLRSRQNIQIPSSGSYTQATGGSYIPCPVGSPSTCTPTYVPGTTGGYSLPPPQSTIQGYTGGGYLTNTTNTTAGSITGGGSSAGGSTADSGTTGGGTTGTATGTGSGNGTTTGIGDCPGFTCPTFATGLKSAGGVACMSTGSGQTFQPCTNQANCPAPGDVRNPTTGQWGKMTPVNTQAQIQCGQCLWQSATCNNSVLQSCTMTFQQITNSLCQG